MLKTLTALSALAIVFAGPVRAEIQFEGNIEFTKKTKACPGSIKLNKQWRSRYHPGAMVAPGENDNNDWTGINRVEDFNAQAWGKGGDFSTSFLKVSNGVLTDRFSGINSDVGTDNSRSKLRLLSIPGPLSLATKTLVIRGQIKNPLGKATQAKCVVDFVGSYQNRDYLTP
jgi:hypothetical protein